MIYLGADHRGYNLKEKIKDWLLDWGYEYEDCGAFELNDWDDYPDFTSVVGRQIAHNHNSEEKMGIVICGSGIGVDIVANKFKGIRCGLAINSDQIKSAREDDDINVLAIASDYIKENQAKEIIKVFLETKFSSQDKYIRRINKIGKIEENLST